MATNRNAFKAGSFILVSIALIIAVIVGIKGIEQFIEHNQTLTVTFKLSDDVGGLKLGDELRVGGLKVGIVRGIRVEPGESSSESKIVVRFQIPQRIILRQGARLAVQNTLTGTSWLNFEDLGNGAVLSPNTVLQGQPSTTSRLLAAVNELTPQISAIAQDIRTVTLPRVNATAENAAALSKALKDKVEPIVERYNKAMDRAAEVMIHARDLLGDTKGDFRATMGNLAAATGSVKEKLPALLDKFDGVLVKLGTSLESANVALEDVKKTVANTRDVSVSAKSIVVGNRGKIDDMIASLKTAGDNLKFATAEVRRSPWRLLYKPGKGEMGNLNLYDSARQFAEGANDLNDASIALRDALKDPTVDQAIVKKLVENLDKTFEGFKQVEQELWQRVKD